ncbi:MAG: hypothetical protein KGJ98_13555 [Chloroflexota bacterium]|nr:hypothetical protein [Chloroflexota bacterium]MDE3194341.1 hypothetical protein [Chloroflexota bacterium]
MSDEIAEFPLPHDATDEERSAARTEIARHTRVVGDDRDRVRLAGRAIGQTGPIWHFQYLRMYELPKGFLIAGHDLREGIKVGFADTAEGLPRCFENDGVREFIEDELRFRGVIGSEHARA